MQQQPYGMMPYGASSQVPPPQYGAVQQQQFSAPFAVNRNPYGQPAMGNVYASPPQHGSLGTPHIPRWNQRSPGGSHDGRHSWRNTPQQGSGSFGQHSVGSAPPPPTENITLVPTRPLLKALARECKPNPPWTVGMPAPKNLHEELLMFTSFLRYTAEEQMRWESLVATIDALFREVWSDSSVCEMGATAAGLSVLKDGTAHFFALNTVDEPSARESLKASATKFGFQVEFAVDYRCMQCVSLTEARTGERCIVRFGQQAKECAVAAELLRDSIANVPFRKAALTAIESLLRQNKVLDDTGLNSNLLNAEAAALMMLAIANSYSKDDEPDAGRLLVDFFLTYGFAAHFDCATHSVSHAGMDPPTSKVHSESQLSVLDPCDPSRNVTPKLDKFSHLQAVFHYCYTAIAQFTQVNVVQRKAQSALSTVIGGETFWSRVLQMHHNQISPFYEVVRDKQHILAQQLV